MKFERRNTFEGVEIYEEMGFKTTDSDIIKFYLIYQPLDCRHSPTIYSRSFPQKGSLPMKINGNPQTFLLIASAPTNLSFSM